VVPEDSLIRRGFENMNTISEEEQATIKKLMEVAYYLAKNGRPYTDFNGLIELEKHHGVAFLKGKSYENETACREFIGFCAEALFHKELEKIKSVNFVSVLSDGCTDAAVIEKECVYLLYVDPEEFKPKLEFFALKEPKSQDAVGLSAVIKQSFEDKQMTEGFQQNGIL
jgi:hypothetical protein